MSDKDIQPESEQDDELEKLSRLLKTSEFANDYLYERNTELEQRLATLEKQYQQSLAEKDAELELVKDSIQQSQRDTKRGLHWISAALFSIGVGLIILGNVPSGPAIVLGIIFTIVSLAIFYFTYRYLD